MRDRRSRQPKSISNRSTSALNLEQSLPVFPAPEESDGDTFSDNSRIQKYFCDGTDIDDGPSRMPVGMVVDVCKF